jgi:hypothetical protein
MDNIEIAIRTRLPIGWRARRIPNASLSELTENHYRSDGRSAALGDTSDLYSVLIVNPAGSGASEYCFKAPRLAFATFAYTEPLMNCPKLEATKPCENYKRFGLKLFSHAMATGVYYYGSAAQTQVAVNQLT